MIELNRTYLWVPGSEYHEAKAAGAKWDPNARRQYVDNVAALANCQRWTVQLIIKDPREAFADACANAGMPLPQGHPIADGKWHRVQADGDRPREASGAYKLFLDGRPAGLIQNHRNGGKLQKWVADVGQVNQAMRERWQAEAQVNREQQARMAVEALAAAKVRFAWEWAALAPAAPDHPYLVKKLLGDIAPQLKQDERGNLCVPIHLLDGMASIVGMQKITRSGFKWIVEGSCKSGSVVVIQPGEHGNPTLLVEGVATGHALAKLAPPGCAVFACLDAGNIKAVAKSLAMGPDRILVAADNDWEKAQKINPKTGNHYENVGPNTAREVMAAVPGVGMFMPPTETMTVQVVGQEKRPKDWADIWVDESRTLQDKRSLVAGLIEGATRLSAPRERAKQPAKEDAGRDDGR